MDRAAGGKRSCVGVVDPGAPEPEPAVAVGEKDASQAETGLASEFTGLLIRLAGNFTAGDAFEGDARLRRTIGKICQRGDTSER
jgi:hypothetical protein